MGCVDDSWPACAPRRQAPQDARLGAMRVNHVKLLPADQLYQATISGEIGQRVDKKVYDKIKGIMEALAAKESEVSSPKDESPDQTAAAKEENWFLKK